MKRRSDRYSTRPFPVDRLRTGVALVAAAAMTMTVAACGGGSSSSSRRCQCLRHRDHRARLRSPRRTVTTPLLYSQGQFQFFSSVYDALFVTTADGTVAPSLVTEVRRTTRTTPTLTLTLKDGVTFTDGSTLDSTLVKANLDRRTDPEPGRPTSSSRRVAALRSPTSLLPTRRPSSSPGPSRRPPASNYLADTSGIIIGKARRRQPGLAGHRTGWFRPLHTEHRRHHEGQHLHLRQERQGLERRTLSRSTRSPGRSSRIRRPGRTPWSPARPTLRFRSAATPSTWSSPSRRSAENGGTIAGFPVFDKTGVTNPAFGKVEVRQALVLGIDRETIVNQLHPGARATSQLFPEGSARFRPGAGHRMGLQPGQGQAVADRGRLPERVLLRHRRRRPAGHRSDRHPEAVGGNRREDELRRPPPPPMPSSRRPPPRRWAGAPQFAIGNPLGFVQGVLYGGFMNLQKATDPTIENGARCGRRLDRCRAGGGAEGTQRRDHLAGLVHLGLRVVHLRRVQREEGQRAGLRRHRALHRPVQRRRRPPDDLSCRPVTGGARLLRPRSPARPAPPRTRKEFDMLAYVARRLLFAVATVLVAILISLLLVHATDGSPGAIVLGITATPSRSQRRTPNWAGICRSGPSSSTMCRAWSRVTSGTSIIDSHSIGDDLVTRLPVTASIAIFSTLLSGIIGIAARRHRRRPRRPAVPGDQFRRGGRVVAAGVLDRHPVRLRAGHPGRVAAGHRIRRIQPRTRSAGPRAWSFRCSR